MDVDHPLPETVPVSYTVTCVERVAGRGGLVALAIVELDIAGVVLTIQGVRIMRRHDALAVEAPAFRSPRDGRSIPALLIPPELRDALASEILAAWRGLSLS
jgi:stage V sporulation protein G